MPSPLVRLALPNYGSLHPNTLPTVMNASRELRVSVRASSFSLLTMNFNSLYCGALNARADGVTHFAMLHADVECEPGWLDVLFRELVRHDADLVSAVVPIKDARGLTSTALTRDAGDPFRVDRRITLRELDALPETFDGPACGDPGYFLLANTGCWVCRLDRPWCERVCFTVRDRIARNDKGEWEPHVEPEDWGFSKQLHRLGGRVLATKKVRATHHGEAGFRNHGPAWGEWERDRVGWEADGRASHPTPV